MLLATVEYARPTSLDEALSLLAANPNLASDALRTGGTRQGTTSYFLETILRHQ